MKAREVPYAASGQRLNRVIATYADGRLKGFLTALHKGGVPHAGNRRYVIDYRKGRAPIPETVILRVCQVYPQVLPGYLKLETPYMTAADERDAQVRGTLLTADATATGSGRLALGDIFKLASGYDRGVTDSLELIEQLTPGGSVARSPLHDVWHRVCEVERVPVGAKRLERLRRLVREVDGLLPAIARPSGPTLETFRLGVLAAMLSALLGAPAPHHPTPRKEAKRTPTKRRTP
ncbi:MAG: hypothetical protein O2973_12715 [Gemmatimonadetes bacterium]|nr:hypothetical protein [Gemmatimonadota bacterium]